MVIRANNSIKKKNDGVAIQTRHAYELYMYCWF